MPARLSKSFAKYYEKAPEKIKKAFKERFNIFLVDSSNTVLNNHALKGTYSGYRSINVTGDWRALYTVIDEIAVFRVLGTHSQLYG